MSFETELLALVTELNNTNKLILDHVDKQNNHTLRVLSAVEHTLGIVDGRLQPSSVNPDMTPMPLDTNLLTELIITLLDGFKLSEEQLIQLEILIKRMRSGSHGNEEKLAGHGPIAPDMKSAIKKYVQEKYTNFSGRDLDLFVMVINDWQNELEEKYKKGGKLPNAVYLG